MPIKKTKPWFAVKRFGYGVGLPIAWQGWMLVTAFVTAMTVCGLLLPPSIFFALLIPMTAAVIYIAYIRSDDEWRWRNGD